MKKRLTSSITSVGMCVTKHNTMKHYHPCIICRNKATIANGKSEKFDFCDTCVLKELFEKLKEYEDAEEQGLLVKLPCKVGDMLYEPTNRKTISTYRIKAIRIELFGIFVEWEIVDGFVYRNISGVEIGEIGKTVFLTKSEAEQALAKLESEVQDGQ
jgi:hypothetical protein